MNNEYLGTSQVDPRPYLPLKVLLVQVVVLVEFVEVLGQLFGALEVVDVDVTVVGGAALVVLGPGAHHDGDYVVAEREDAVSFTV